jgi:hypothetical protein
MGDSRGFRDLKVYQLAFNLAMEVYFESKHFPAEEKYSLTDQIRRASRSVPGILAKGIAKSGTQKCLSVRWLIRTERQPKPKYGWILPTSVDISLRVVNWN